MNREQILEAYSMRDVAGMYGIQPNRAGFCSCPFHLGDRTPSLKLYKKDFHCYACGANGDIFKFVELMENCNFREAYQRLGGEYKKATKQDKKKLYRAKARIEKNKRTKKHVQMKKTEIIECITKYREQLNNSEPLSDEWAAAYNKLQYFLYLDSEMNGLEY